MDTVFAPGLLGLVSFVLAAVLPAVVALVVKRSYSATVKALILLGLAAVKSVGVALVANGHLDVATLTATGYSFVIAVGVYFGLLKGTALHSTLLDALNADPDLLPYAARVGVVVPALPADFSMPAETLPTVNELIAAKPDVPPVA